MIGFEPREQITLLLGRQFGATIRLGHVLQQRVDEANAIFDAQGQRLFQDLITTHLCIIRRVDLPHNCHLTSSCVSHQIVAHEPGRGSRGQDCIEAGVAGVPKKISFASHGPRLEIGFKDAINNEIVILKHEASCLVFEEAIPRDGLLWEDLVQQFPLIALQPLPPVPTARSMDGLSLQVGLTPVP